MFDPLCHIRKVEDLQFRVEEESITKGDLEVFIILSNCVRSWMCLHTLVEV